MTPTPLLRGSLPEPEPDQPHWSESALEWLLIILACLALCGLAFVLLTGNAEASDKCSNPGLSPELKKACYEMVEACKQIQCSVSVR